MLTFEEAKKIGIRACVDKLGYDFVRKYEDLSCTAYEDEGDRVFCFVGVSTEPVSAWNGDHLVLDDTPNTKFPYSASCYVLYADGTITFLDCSLPVVA